MDEPTKKTICACCGMALPEQSDNMNGKEVSDSVTMMGVFDIIDVGFRISPRIIGGYGGGRGLCRECLIAAIKDSFLLPVSGDSEEAESYVAKMLLNQHKKS
jgi:hypothetical protein